MMVQITSSYSANLCKRILATVLVVYRPITLAELSSLVDIPAAANLIEVIELCGSLLTIRDYTISFVHQSAKDFLLENASKEIFSDGKKPHTIPYAPSRYRSCLERYSAISIASTLPAFPLTESSILFQTP